MEGSWVIYSSATQSMVRSGISATWARKASGSQPYPQTCLLNQNPPHPTSGEGSPIIQVFQMQLQVLEATEEKPSGLNQ